MAGSIASAAARPRSAVVARPGAGRALAGLIVAGWLVAGWLVAGWLVAGECPVAAGVVVARLAAEKFVIVCVPLEPW